MQIGPKFVEFLLKKIILEKKIDSVHFIYLEPFHVAFECSMVYEGIQENCANFSGKRWQ
jgi:hypothetical protein